MKVSLNWLREFVAIELTPEALAERLTMAGLEVEGITRYGHYDGMIAGRIVELGKHPNADKLAICTVDVGAGEALRVVSGAPNLQAGMLVPVAMPGAVLGDGTRVEATVIRGIASTAVVLSEREIGISDDHSGVMQLETGAEPGERLATILGTADTVLEVSITPNRGDCLSIVGIARELAALTAARLKIPASRLAERPPAAPESIRVEIEDAEACGRYVARLVRGVRIAPSPLWMRARLEALGVRAINNVVDVTNYVMLERGQPLHAFDAARVRGGKIVVRRAGTKTTFRTLDDADRALESDDLLIADAEGGIALAGVMGGATSAVTDSTTDILLEAAHFAPGVIRRTSRRLGLRSEASLRFERGVDIEGVPVAAARAAELLAKLARGQVATGAVDAYPKPHVPIDVLVRSDRANRLLGTALPVAEIGQSLRRISASVRAGGKGGYLCRAPSYRSDLTREADFIEEIARMAGYDRIPETLPRAVIAPGFAGPLVPPVDRACDLLVAQGLHEMRTLRFVSEAWNARVAGLVAGGVAVKLRNPMSSEVAEMRRSLLPNLILAAARNRRGGEPWVRGFEIGTVFAEENGRHRERQAVGGILVGPLPARGLVREDRSESLYDAKGVVAEMLSGLGVERVEWRAQGIPSFLHPGKSASVEIPGAGVIGIVGGLHPEIARAADLDADAWAFELDFEKLEPYCSRRVTFRTIPKYPAIVRDLAIVANEQFEAQAVLDTIASCSDLPVENTRLFDLYRGAPLPAGKKSLAYSISYRAADRTLTDDEVNQFHRSLIERVTRTLGVELRG